MTLAAAPATTSSLLARWDARWKLAAILIAIAAVAFLQSITACLIALTISLGLIGTASVTVPKLASRIGLIILALLPVLIAMPLVEGGTRLAATLSLRALAIGLFAYALLASTPLDRLVEAARSLGLPGALTQILLLTHRYTGLLIDEVRRLRIAWRVRGFQPATSLRTYRTCAEGIGAVLVRSGNRGERVSAAMRVRGFDGHFHLAVPFHAGLADALAALALMATMIGLALWDRLA